MRSFSRQHWETALRAWELGEFSDEWKPYRHAAVLRGMIYPPEGTKRDSWSDDNPSQRAILIRAIRETPVLLMQSIDSASSWGEVIAKLMKSRDELREEVLREENFKLEASQVLRAILRKTVYRD